MYVAQRVLIIMYCQCLFKKTKLS